jgi:hypothetical protein
VTLVEHNAERAAAHAERVARAHELAAQLWTPPGTGGGAQPNTSLTPPIPGPNRAQMRSVLRGLRTSRRVEWPGTRYAHQSAWTKRPLAVRRAERRAVNRAAKRARRASR